MGIKRYATKVVNDMLCKMGNHDWMDGPGFPCRNCGAVDALFGICHPNESAQEVQAKSRYRTEGYINCDLCHKYVPTKYCQPCGIDWCEKCDSEHDGIHQKVQKAASNNIDAVRLP